MAGVGGSTLRIIDANLNRSAEGLRVIEDVARFALDNEALSSELKALRHGVVRTTASFQQELVRSRDAAGDVGKDTEVPGEEGGRELVSVVVANCRRVQESLRVLEELAKLSSVSDALESEKFKAARFRLYSIEKQMLSLLAGE